VLQKRYELSMPFQSDELALMFLMSLGREQDTTKIKGQNTAKEKLKINII
jgi:hypothetical protein